MESQTREQFEEKLREMAARVPDSLITEGLRLWDAHEGRDIPGVSEGDSYIGPKLAVSAALLTEAWRWMPSHPSPAEKAFVRASSARAL